MRWTLKRDKAKPEPEGNQRQATQIAVPDFGYKNHIGIDRRHGLIRRWTVTAAAQHGSRSFAGLLDPDNTASRVWADTAYCTKRNPDVLERRGWSERILFRRPPRRPFSEQQAKANASRARIARASNTVCCPEAPCGAVPTHHRRGSAPELRSYDSTPLLKSGTGRGRVPSRGVGAMVPAGWVAGIRLARRRA
ncbi:transposase [Teichococcus aestuarii]|uniref:transposase n=1 Tax=Teichococcus aestuarii TaxID=568898 RepID=UPI0036062327